MFGFSITLSSRLPEMYHMATRSPSLITLPPTSMSASAVRAMWAKGVCQRIVSDTIEGMRPWSARNLSYWSRFRFSS